MSGTDKASVGVWKPIETFFGSEEEKSGSSVLVSRQVLLWNGRFQYVGSYDKQFKCWFLPSPMTDPLPTHWMPLPEPPGMNHDEQ